ncbi:hypothetical protein Tco_0504073, partial [Tanacetum coccineum]
LIGYELFDFWNNLEDFLFDLFLDDFLTLLEFCHTSIGLQRPLLPASYLLDIDQQMPGMDWFA